MEEIVFHLVELANDPLLYVIPCNVSTKLQLIFDQMRHDSLDYALNVFPVMVLIIKADCLWEIPLPVGQRHLVRLRRIKFFYYFGMLLLQCFDRVRNFKLVFQIFWELRNACLCRQVDHILDKVEQKWP